MLGDGREGVSGGASAFDALVDDRLPPLGISFGMTAAGVSCVSVPGRPGIDCDIVAAVIVYEMLISKVATTDRRGSLKSMDRLEATNVSR